MLRLPESAGLIFNFQFGKGYLFPVVLADGGRGPAPMTAQHMTAALQGHLRAAAMPDQFTTHSLGLGGSASKSLAGTAVDEIMKIGEWKTERIAKYYIGSTTSARVSVQEETEPRLYGRGRATAVSNIRVRFFRVRAEVRLMRW